MAIDQLSYLLNEIAAIHKIYEAVVDIGFLIFSRILGFMMVAPIFGRKDVPFNMKIGIAMMLTWVLVWLQPLDAHNQGLLSSANIIWYLLQVFMNIVLGIFIGWIGACIMEAINSAGSLMNNQIGLSSAMMFDPSTRQQVALTEKIFGFVALMLLFHIGGVYWFLNALVRSFEVFPLHIVNQDITGQISLEYVILITGNSLAIGTQLVAPVMVVTMAVDLILGIVNRTAQQIQVFQLSFALKPCIGMSAFLVSLPIFLKMIEHYLSDYASIF
jgi:flagellar biosynthesis protein FliR